MKTQQRPASGPNQIMQGQVVAPSSVNPSEFARTTRRMRFVQYNAAFVGLGATDTIKISKTGILSELLIQASGTVTVTLNAGTCASTSRWPYDLIKNCRFAANGQSQLINVSGAKLKAFEIMRRGDFTDRGVVQAIGGASPGTARSQGTLAMNSESWGIGSNVTAIAGGAYSFNLEWVVPVAADQGTLIGAIFAQTSSTDLTLAIDWAPVADLFTLTGLATAVIALTLKVISTVYTIPSNGQGGIYIPDLSAFHTLTQSTVSNAGTGVNEIPLIGQGAGRQLLRIFTQVWNGNPSGIFAVNDTNFGQFGLKFGASDQPEQLGSGTLAAMIQERTFNSDLASQFGFLTLDFASEFAYRDSYDEGTASELRIVIELLGVLTNPKVEYVQETIASGVA